jgi:hypothetical protein
LIRYELGYEKASDIGHTQGSDGGGLGAERRHKRVRKRENGDREKEVRSRQ